MWKCPKSGSQHWRQPETTQQNTKKKKKMIWKPVKVAWEDLFHRLIMQYYLVFRTQAEEKQNLSMPPCGSVWILIKHWHIIFPEPAVHPDSRLPSVSFKCWFFFFVLDVKVKCCGKKTGWSRKPSGVSLVTIWAPEGSRSSAKTVDPQFHFKGMEVWKQAGETHRKGKSRKWARI